MAPKTSSFLNSEINGISVPSFMKAFFFAAALFCLSITLAAEPIRVTSLSTILTEIAEKVGAPHITVTPLVKPGTDPHDFEPKPADLALLASSQLILASGKNLEGYLTKLHGSSGSTGTLVEVGNKIPSLEKSSETESHSHSDGHHSHIEDPHWWHSITNVALATGVVRDELIKIDPAHAADYRTNADAYLQSLDQLSRWAKLKISELPRDQRKLVTSHDAFQYFAREFGFTLYAIEGISTEDEPSNRKILSLIDTIRRERVKAIFGEFGHNPKVSATITRESGAKPGRELYADGLGTGDAATYEGMMKHNLTAIVEGLK